MELGTAEFADAGDELLLLFGSDLRASSDGVDASVAEEAMLLAELREGAENEFGPDRFPRPGPLLPPADASGVETLFVPVGAGSASESCCGSGSDEYGDGYCICEKSMFTPGTGLNFAVAGEILMGLDKQ